MAKTDRGKGAQDGDLFLAIVLALSLTIPIVVGIFAEQFRSEGLIREPVADAVVLLCVTLLGVGVSYVLWKSSEKGQVRHSALLAAVLLILSQVINLTTEYAALKDVPILGGASGWNALARNILVSGGLGLFMASFGLALLDGNWARRLLRQRQEELLQEIAERKRIETALRDSEEKYRQLFDGANDGIALIGKDMRPLLINQRLYDILGYPPGEISAAEAVELIHPDDRERLAENNRRRLAGETVERTYEFTMRHTEGHYIHIEGSFDLIRRGGQIIGSQGILRDVTDRRRNEEERRRLQSKIQQAQKLESLGVLAGGIAHDFNNLLMGVLGNASLALLELPAGSPVRRNLEQIEKAGQRAAELSKQMLAYSGKGRFILQPINISILVEEMIHLLKVSISKKVEMVYEFDADMPTVEGDPTQLGQVVLSLITNASEAIGDNPGTITVRTGEADLAKADVEEAYLRDDFEEGRYAFLEVSDTGAGMDAETVARIFDPFFSTKFTGRGLGLAAVMGIVRGHEGTIRVDSEPSRGSTFRMFFPCAETVTVVEPQSVVVDEEWRAEGMVLVVDDEESVLDVAKQVLEECGFSVLLAHDGKEGVEVFRTHSDEIVLVLLDLTMPQMGGHEAYEEIRRLRADAQVLLSSGYDESEAAARFAGKGLAGFIQKPYRVQELVSAVRGVLEGSHA